MVQCPAFSGYYGSGMITNNLVAMPGRTSGQHDVWGWIPSGGKPSAATLAGGLVIGDGANLGVSYDDGVYMGMWYKCVSGTLRLFYADDGPHTDDHACTSYNAPTKTLVPTLTVQPTDTYVDSSLCHVFQSPLSPAFLFSPLSSPQYYFIFIYYIISMHFPIITPYCLIILIYYAAI